MPFASGDNARIRTNTPSENAYNALARSNMQISRSQLKLSTGKRINNASDDVAGYITSRAIQARNGALKSALLTIGDALNVTNIIQDSLDNIDGLIRLMKDATAQAASGALGTDERVALAKAAFRLAQQIQTVVDSTVFGGYQLIGSDYSTNFFVGIDNRNNLLTISIDMTDDNIDFNVDSRAFNPNSMGGVSIFAGVTNLDLEDFNLVRKEDLGIFSTEKIGVTITSLAEALNNVNKVAAYVGGIANRLFSQEELLKEQIVNYNAANSRIEDTDVAKEQLELVKSQFLQQASLTSLSQSNQNPNAFLQLIRS